MTLKRGSERVPNSPKAIATQYAGYRMRSRLEARWAVFFDRLGIRWEYEPEGYWLSGRPYLPDFKLMLPGDRIVFVEVKHSENDEHEGAHVDLCRQLARAVEQPVLLLTGVPGYRMYHLFSPTLAPNEFMAAFFVDYGEIIRITDDYWFQLAILNEETGVWEFLHDEPAAIKSFGAGLVDAVDAARSARFEHAERPGRSGI
jgi:hypothetical protein